MLALAPAILSEKTGLSIQVVPCSLGSGECRTHGVAPGAGSLVSGIIGVARGGMSLPRGSDGGEGDHSQFVCHKLICVFVSTDHGGGGQEKDGCPYMGVVMEHKGFGSWAHHMAGALTSY